MTRKKLSPKYSGQAQKTNPTSHDTEGLKTMATQLQTLETAPVATDPLAAPAPTPAPVALDPLAAPAPVEIDPEALLAFTVGENDDTAVQINMKAIPSDTRMDMLRSALKSFVTNRISTAVSTAKTSNKTFDLYDAATANDPLQTLVPKPEGERKVVNVQEVVDNALKALYEGKFGRRDGTGGKKAKTTRDPLVTQITRAVIQEIFEKNKKLDNSYKYPTAAKEVGQDGLAYLKSKIEAKIAAGGDAKQLNDMLETRYVRPARTMLGLDIAPRFRDVEGIL